MDVTYNGNITLRKLPFTSVLESHVQMSIMFFLFFSCPSYPSCPETENRTWQFSMFFLAGLPTESLRTQKSKYTCSGASRFTNGDSEFRNLYTTAPNLPRSHQKLPKTWMHISYLGLAKQFSSLSPPQFWVTSESGYSDSYPSTRLRMLNLTFKLVSSKCNFHYASLST